MSFLAGSFLWLLPLAAVPVIIHFLNRKKAKSINISTLRFIQPATKNVLKRFKILQFILLLLRVMAVVMLTLAFARPVWRGYTTTRETSKKVILIDNSYTMGYRKGTENALDISRELANELVMHFDGEFAVGEFNSSLARIGRFKSNEEELLKEIEQIELTNRTSDYGSVMRELSRYLSEEYPGEKISDVIILSDFNRAAFMGTAPEGGREYNLLLIDTCKGESNLWIEDVMPERAFSRKRTGVKFKIRSVKDVSASAGLYIDGERRDRKTFKDASEVNSEFVYNFERPGIYECKIEVTAEPRKNRIYADSKRFFTVKVFPRIRVLLVDGDVGYTLMSGESYFMSNALSPGTYDAPVISRVVTPDEMKEMAVEEYDVMMLLNVDPDEELVRRVSSYVKGGGGVAVFPGRRYDYTRYNRLLSQIIPVELVSEKARDVQAAMNISSPRGFEEIFEKGVSVDFERIVETRSEVIEESEIKAGGYPLLWFYDSEPDRGKTAFFATTANMRWSDFPVNPSFPPFVQKLVKRLALDDEGESSQLKIGDVAKLYSGERRVEEPGIYEGENGPVAVNLDVTAGGSALRYASEDEIEEFFSGSEVTYLPFAENMKRQLVRYVTGQERSGFFLGAFVVFLAFEEILRKYLGKRENA